MIACKDCRYWAQTTGHPDGECHRHAPQVIAEVYSDRDSDGQLMSVYSSNSRVFPTTMPSDWCGEAELVRTNFAEELKKFYS